MNMEIENTDGYKIAISFKPFIDSRCTEHMEIVKDMAKAINSTLDNAIDRNGRAFNKGYKEGRNYTGFGKMKAEYDKLKKENALLIEALQGLYSEIDRQALNYRFGAELGKAKELLNNLKK